YILNMLGKNSTFYNIPSVVVLSGDIDKQRFEKAFRTLIERHESLRTSFEMLEDEPVQRVHETVDFEISYMEEAESRAEELIRAFIRPFDLSKAPLMRVGLMKVREEKHLLMFDIHHAVSDGLSLNIIIKEYLQLYNGEALNPLTLQYKDYAVWQREQADSEPIKMQKEFWMDTFSGELPVLNMPTDYPRPPVQSFEGDIVRKILNAEVLEFLNKKAAEADTTLFILLLAAYNVLLHKYSGQEDIVIGTPISGRRSAELNGVIGMFANTIALRNRPMGNKTFASFLKEVKENALASYDKQDFQFEDLVENLDIPRDLSRNPLFAVMLNFLYPEESAKAAEFSLYEFENSISKFDMTVHAAETGAGLELSLEYCTVLFKKETARRMLEHFANIITGIIAFPDSKLNEIEMISDEEKQQVLTGFNNTAAAYPKEKTIRQLFEERAEQLPDKTAVVFNNSTLTYKELNQRANQLARVLITDGVAADSIVGIITEPSLEMFIGIMGILKAGGAYLPIDPGYPADRVNYMLEDSGAKILLTYSHMTEKHNNMVKPVHLLDSESLYSGNNDNLPATGNPADLAYVIYTSGTTGKPKGVMLENKSLVNYVSWFSNEAGITDKDKTMLLSSAAFDLGYTALYPSMLQGAELHVMAREAYTDPEALVKYINDRGITYIKLTPSLYSAICSCDSFLEGKGLGSLRLVISGGEQINVTDMENTYRLYKHIKIMNHYGPTETTVGTAAYMTDIGSFEAFKEKPVIGRPISNNRIYMVDKYLKPAAVGVPGEICVAGEGLARGYLNRKLLTEEKFIPNPFIEGERIYKTGDMGRWLSDGSIEFMGRIDQQVKIRGYRIELGEIENRLIRIEYVKEAVVIAKEGLSGSYLCAYVVAEVKLEKAELKKHLAKELPDYMIPTYFVQLDKIPVTKNGKLDRKALPEPEAGVASGIEYEAARNEVEEKLVELWQQVLRLERIGINDNFFELGGHSLKATSLMSKIHKELSVEIPLREIFRLPTIKGLSEHIKGQEENIYAEIQPVEAGDCYELSSAQKRLYTLHKLEEDSKAYNMPGVLIAEGKLDTERLEAAFGKLIERHEALRTSFEIMGEAIVQVVHKEVKLEIEYREAEEEEIEEIVGRFVRVFDLSKAPLLRVGLIKVRPEKHILMYDMHHIISDGMSRGIMINEFAKLYEGKELKKLRIQYKDFSSWQNELFKTERIKHQEAYWIKEFGGEIPVLDIPADYPRPAMQSFEGDRIYFELSEELTAGLRKLAKETETTMYMVLLAGVNILLSKYSGQQDIVIGSPIAGRPHENLENIIGMFVNTLAIRSYPEGRKKFREFLEEVKVKCLKAYENQDYQFEELVEKLDIRRDMSRNPLFDVMLVLQNTEMAAVALEGLSFTSYESRNMVSKFDLTINAVEGKARLGIGIEYCTKLFSRETIERLKAHLANILEDITVNTEKRLSELTLLSKEEEYKLLYKFNDTSAEYPRGKAIHRLFEEQADKTPDKVAAEYEDKQLTYRELNERANRLGRALRGKGVGTGSMVGIMTEHSLEMLAGMLGILKAGGAYVPIDPDYPEERIQYILEDSGVTVLLTQAKLKDSIRFDGELICLEEEDTYKGDKHNLEDRCDPHSLAYVIYTSGSTGKPKGVMIEHRSVANFIEGMRLAIGFCERDSILCLTSISFDIMGLETLLPLTTGMKIAIAGKEAQRDAAMLSQIIEKGKINTLQTTPSRMQMLLGSEEGRRSISGLDTIMIGGEALPAVLLKEVQSISKARLYNMYGPTETTIWSAVKELTGEERITIG
ncbi:MAG TPA: amino acid adenylation domain-containing protein, partial [Clostridia bacterium]|nr:amino acid adenylation domain-containing protein [Clostridia bacterium]